MGRLASGPLRVTEIGGSEKMTLHEIFSTFDENITLYEVISVFISLGALILVLWQIREIQMQLKCNFHQEFVRRYTELVTKMPYRAFEDRQLTLADCVEEKSDFKTTAQLYFWLIQEEQDLLKKHKVPTEQWRIWDSQFRLTMKSKCFRQVWEDVKKVAAYPDDFVCYVDRIKREYELDESTQFRSAGCGTAAIQEARDFFRPEAANWSDAKVVNQLLIAAQSLSANSTHAARVNQSAQNQRRSARSHQTKR
jgi:hypothetical protein